MVSQAIEISAPLLGKRLPGPREPNTRQRNSASRDDLILEAWSQGFLVGGLIVLVMITVANMRRGVLLHKLILIEVRLIVLLGTARISKQLLTRLTAYHGVGTRDFHLYPRSGLRLVRLTE